MKSLWLDGNFIQAKPSLVESFTPGIFKAKGVFETMRAVDGRVMFLDFHLRRMFRGLRVLGVSRPLIKDFKSIYGQLLNLNGLKDARMRLMVWNKNGLHAAILCERISLTKQKYAKGFKVTFANRRHFRKTKEPIKSLDYALFRDAYQDAVSKGFDEALFLNGKKEMIEGSRTNIFLIKNEILRTPPITSGCLPGITRQIILQCARKLKVRCVCRALLVQELLDADEAFLTNSILGVMPLTWVDGNKIGSGCAGVVTSRLSQSYNSYGRA